jgi:hypothetical protein
LIHPVSQLKLTAILTFALVLFENSAFYFNDPIAVGFSKLNKEVSPVIGFSHIFTDHPVSQQKLTAILILVLFPNSMR